LNIKFANGLDDSPKGPVQEMLENLRKERMTKWGMK
jgi:hypothetical protein